MKLEERVKILESQMRLLKDIIAEENKFSLYKICFGLEINLDIMGELQARMIELIKETKGKFELLEVNAMIVDILSKYNLKINELNIMKLNIALNEFNEDIIEEVIYG